MTENEVLMILENLKPGCGEQLVFPEGEICEAIDIAISALKEIPAVPENRHRGRVPGSGGEAEYEETKRKKRRNKNDSL